MIKQAILHFLIQRRIIHKKPGLKSILTNSIQDMKFAKQEERKAQRAELNKPIE